MVILDEPTTGLDPRSRNALWDVIRERSEQGTSVLLTTQHLEEAGRLADRIVLIENGCAVADGTPDQLKDLVGSTVLEARVGVPDTERAAALLADLGQRRPSIDPQEQRITIPGIRPETLPTVSRRLAEARVEVIELGVRLAFYSRRCSLPSPNRQALPAPGGGRFPYQRPLQPAGGDCGEPLTAVRRLPGTRAETSGPSQRVTCAVSRAARRR